MTNEDFFTYFMKEHTKAIERSKVVFESGSTLFEFDGLRTKKLKEEKTAWVNVKTRGKLDACVLITESESFIIVNYFYINRCHITFSGTHYESSSEILQRNREKSQLLSRFVTEIKNVKEVRLKLLTEEVTTTASFNELLKEVVV